MSLCSRNVALMAVLGIAFVILFPATFGPFQVTNGPASSLRAIADADLVIFCLCFLVIVLRQNPLSGIQLSHPGSTYTFSSSPPVLTLRC